MENINLVELLATDNFAVYNKKVAKKMGIETAVLLGTLCSLQKSFKNEEFYRSEDELAEDTLLSIYSIRKCKRQLEEIGILEIEKKGLPAKHYFKINANKLLMLITSDNEIVTTSGNEMITTSTNENNTTNNNIYNNINNNKKKERKKTSYDEILNSMIEDDDVKNTICDYIKMRKLIKKPMTDRAVTMLINKLYKLSNNKQIQIKILEQSILKNWTDIYPYKEENNYAGYQGNAKTDLSKYDR